MDKIIQDPLFGDIKFPKLKSPKEPKPTKQPSKATTQKPKK